VSEGRGLREERLGGRRTKEGEERGGAGQIPMDHGAPMLGRGTGMSSREGSARLQWLGPGSEVNVAEKGHRSAAGICF
jgi:hypothetical protein